MSHPFDDYGKTVCTFVRHATTGEKQLIQRELADHMEDRAAALMDAGYDEERAQRAAVEAMGDPEEVGRALNKAYPLRWLVLHRVMLTCFLLSLLLFSQTLPETVTTVAGNLQARIAPTTHASFPYESDIDPQSLDIVHELPNGRVLSIFSVDLKKNPQGAAPHGDKWYDAHVYTVQYSKNPFSPQHIPGKSITFSIGETPCDFTPAWGNEEGAGTQYIRYTIPGTTMGDSLTVRYSYLGTSFEEEVFLPWKEVPS